MPGYGSYHGHPSSANHSTSFSNQTPIIPSTDHWSCSDHDSGYSSDESSLPSEDALTFDMDDSASFSDGYSSPDENPLSSGLGGLANQPSVPNDEEQELNELLQYLGDQSRHVDQLIGTSRSYLDLAASMTDYAQWLQSWARTYDSVGRERLGQAHNLMRAINNLTDLWQRRASREETAQAVQPNQIPTQQQQEVVHEATSDVLPREEIQPDTPLSELLTSSDHEPEERHNIEQWISLVERLPADNGIRDAMRSVILDSEQYYLFFMESPADALEEGRGAHTQTTEDYNDDAERFLAEWSAMAEEALDGRQWFVLRQTLQAYWNNQVEDVVLVATVRLLFAPDIILDEQSNYFHLHKLWLVFREVIFTEPVSLVKSSGHMERYELLRHQLSSAMQE